MPGMSAKPKKLAKGLWRWTERHPEWHPGEFGREVACFAVDAGGEDLLLIDPLLPEDPAPVFELMDEVLRQRLTLLVTIPYHVRSAEEIRRRYRRQAKTTIRGHAAAAKRLEDRTGFREIESGAELPGGVTAHRIGNPVRQETPLHLPSHGALVFGDAVVEVDGGLRVWSDRRVDDKVERFYRERFNPTLEPLLDLDFERVLVTHGEPVMQSGKDELRSALRRKPWYHHG
jgi:hypothetical protein